MKMRVQQETIMSSKMYNRICHKCGLSYIGKKHSKKCFLCKNEEQESRIKKRLVH